MFRTACCFVLVALGWGTICAADELPEGLLCPVSGEEVDAEVHRDYRGANVYFCCDKCAAAFERDSSAYAVKANLQLVQTDQATQTACPLTGKPAKDGVQVDVGGVAVGLCCGGCQKKAENASEDEREEMAFSDEAFERGFKVKEKSEDS